MSESESNGIDYSRFFPPDSPESSLDISDIGYTINESDQSDSCDYTIGVDGRLIVNQDIPSDDEDDEDEEDEDDKSDESDGYMYMDDEMEMDVNGSYESDSDDMEVEETDHDQKSKSHFENVETTKREKDRARQNIFSTSLGDSEMNVMSNESKSKAERELERNKQFWKRFCVSSTSTDDQKSAKLPSEHNDESNLDKNNTSSDECRNNSSEARKKCKTILPISVRPYIQDMFVSHSDIYTMQFTPQSERSTCAILQTDCTNFIRMSDQFTTLTMDGKIDTVERILIRGVSQYVDQTKKLNKQLDTYDEEVDQNIIVDIDAHLCEDEDEVAILEERDRLDSLANQASLFQKTRGVPDYVSVEHPADKEERLIAEQRRRKDGFSTLRFKQARKNCVVCKYFSGIRHPDTEESSVRGFFRLYSPQ